MSRLDLGQPVASETKISSAVLLQIEIPDYFVAEIGTMVTLELCGHTIRSDIGAIHVFVPSPYLIRRGTFQMICTPQ